MPLCILPQRRPKPEVTTPLLGHMCPVYLAGTLGKYLSGLDTLGRLGLMSVSNGI